MVDIFLLEYDVPDCFHNHFIHCRPFDLLQHPKELARQITLIDHGKIFDYLLVFNLHNHLKIRVLIILLPESLFDKNN